MKRARSLSLFFIVVLLCGFQESKSLSCCGQIRQEDIVNGLFTISLSGVYELEESVTGKIVIYADDVILDLCGKKITNDSCTLDPEGVEVHPGFKNTVIKNGTVESTCDRGIVIYDTVDCCGPTLERLRVQNCAKEAVLFQGVVNGHIKGCDFISSATGLVLDQSEQTRVEDSVASCNRLAGFALHNSSYNCFSRCRAFANGGGDLDLAAGPNLNNIDRFGFVSTDGCGNVFQECCAEANTIPFFDPIGFCRSVAGFAFVGTETCSKIIDCKSENNWAPYQFDVFQTHSLVKSATPYGILLKSKLHVVGDKELELVTAVDPGDEAGDGNENDIVRSVDWSPDGKYLAVGGDFPLFGSPEKKDLRVYAFDLSASPTLALLAAVNPGSGSENDIVYTVNWSPDGKHLAVGGIIRSGTDSKDLRVYAFDPAASMPLTLLTAVDPGDEAGDGNENDIVRSVDWSPDGKYLAVGGDFPLFGSPEKKDLRVYAFDPAASNPLILVTAVDPGDEPDGPGGYDRVYSVDWSPDGKHLAVGGSIYGAGGDNKDLRVYSFDLATSPTLTLVTAVDPGDDDTSDIVRTVDWSPDGCFLAVGGSIHGEDSKDLRVYAFDLSASPTLALIASVDPGDEAGGGDKDDIVWSVDWSPDGKYLAVGGSMPTYYSTDPQKKDLRVYAFDLSASNTLTLLAAVLPGFYYEDNSTLFPLGLVGSVAWSPDGQYLAMGGWIAEGTYVNPGGGPDFKQLEDLRIYKALDFPTKNVIKRNIVACNCIRPEEQADECGCELDVCPKGVGISGTSICNMIMENEAYNNPFNYQFVTNVFDQRFGNMPSLLQNIALGACEPVCIPYDCGRIQRRDTTVLRRLIALVNSIQT